MVCKLDSKARCPLIPMVAPGSMGRRLCLLGLLVPAAAFRGCAIRAVQLPRRQSAVPSRLPPVALSAAPWEATWDPLTGSALITRDRSEEEEDEDPYDLTQPSAYGEPGSVPEWVSWLNELQARHPSSEPQPPP